MTELTKLKRKAEVIGDLSSAEIAEVFLAFLKSVQIIFSDV